MGPEGGSRGGLVIAEGTPEQVAANSKSYTGAYLKPLLDGQAVPVRATQPALVPATRADAVVSDKLSARRATVKAS
jgi:excinuclease ABC subunit A